MRRLTVAVTLFLMASPVSVGAAATQETGQTGGQIVSGAPEAVVVVGRSGTVGSWTGTPRGGSSWSCGYFDYDFDYGPDRSDGGLATVRYDDGPVDPEADRPYVLVCRDASGAVVRSRLQVYDPSDPLGGIAATERALDEARRRLDLPLPRPGLNPPGAQLVGVPTWLWVDGPWAPGSATASIGAVSATVTAQPVRVDWELGDGTDLTCGPGSAYEPAVAPSGQQSDCTHVYSRASTALPGGAYTVRATITYDVTWSASTGGGGSLGGLARSATVPVRVTEAQALIR